MGAGCDLAVNTEIRNRPSRNILHHLLLQTPKFEYSWSSGCLVIENDWSNIDGSVLMLMNCVLFLSWLIFVMTILTHYSQVLYLVYYLQLWNILNLFFKGDDFGERNTIKYSILQHKSENSGICFCIIND